MLTIVHLIAIYPVNSVIQSLKNWGQKWTYDGAFEQLFGPGRWGGGVGGFEENISKNSNARGVTRRDVEASI